MLRSRTAKIVSIAGALILLYLTGLILRDRYGILIVITNSSGDTLEGVTVIVTGSLERKNIYVAGTLAPGKRTRLFVRPTTESHINLDLVHSTGEHQEETIAGYVEGGYCGKIAVSIFPDGMVKGDEKIDPVTCWKKLARLLVAAGLHQTSSV